MNEEEKKAIEILKDIKDGALPPELSNYEAEIILNYINNSIPVKKIEEMLDRMIRQYEKYEYLGDTKRNGAYDICIGMVEQLIKENTEGDEE